MADDALTETQRVKRNRLWQGWLWVKGNILPVLVIAAGGGLIGHLEAYIGFGYRLSKVEDALNALPTADAREKAKEVETKWKQQLEDHDAEHERRLTRIEDNLNLDLNEKERKAREERARTRARGR